MLLLASHGRYGSRGPGTNSPLCANCSDIVRRTSACKCLGSLKTEEKTERQCGQRGYDPDFGHGWLDAVLSIHKSPGSQPGAQIKSDECYQHTLFPCDALSSQPNRVRASNGSIRFLLESLILAQDERWRRA